MASRCPLCRGVVPSGATNCPRCGARIAALPRQRPVEPARVQEKHQPTPGERAAARREGLRAGIRGVVAGLALTAACALLAAVVQLAGGSGYSTFGNATLATGGLCIVGSAVAGGFRLIRWDEYQALRERLEQTRRVGSRRISLISAGLLLILVSGLTAARH